MDSREAKLALARKKLKDHQVKKTVQKDETNHKLPSSVNPLVETSACTIEEFIITPNNSQISEEQIINPVVHTDNIDHAMSHNVDIKPNIVSDMHTNNVNVTEILISSKRNLELQVQDLQVKLAQLEHDYALVTNNYKICNQKVYDLDIELQNINTKYLNATQELLIKDSKLNEFNSLKLSLSEENTNLVEQLEFTKTMLNGKEAENDSLHSQLYSLQSQYDVICLQLQQLTNGTPSTVTEKVVDNEKIEAMLQKISNLEQQLNMLQKERDQMNVHYEHYVGELNEQLKAALQKNEDLTKEVHDLSYRENSLIEQISDMEIRIQNYNVDKKKYEIDQNTSNIKVLQEDLKQVQGQYAELQIKYEQLQHQYAASEAKVNELSEQTETGCNHDNISISKLSADMTSDKVAAQRATEQNKKLKQDIQGLEDAFVKMSKDKLELTEKITAEKFLNRELTIKLAEVEEKSKNMLIKLKAKDEEMIRLQSNYREIEKQYEQMQDLSRNHANHADETGEIAEEKPTNNNNATLDSDSETEHKPLTEEICVNKCLGLPKDDAMVKLQERFLKIMGDVADLSDEKHRLEHIILQLQNETDTICEYVALYQQQRSLLKKRDDERSAQLKVFQQECAKLKCELEELSGILARFAEDEQLLSYFQIESRRKDMEKVLALLINLKNNSLIDPKKKKAEFKNFYPCNCCSGKLIDV